MEIQHTRHSSTDGIVAKRSQSNPRAIGQYSQRRRTRVSISKPPHGTKKLRIIDSSIEQVRDNSKSPTRLYLNLSKVSPCNVQFSDNIQNELWQKRSRSNNNSKDSIAITKSDIECSQQQAERVSIERVSTTGVYDRNVEWLQQVKSKQMISSQQQASKEILERNKPMRNDQQSAQLQRQIATRIKLFKNVKRKKFRGFQKENKEPIINIQSVESKRIKRALESEGENFEQRYQKIINKLDRMYNQIERIICE